jgi:hypothetical protein
VLRGNMEVTLGQKQSEEGAVKVQLSVPPQSKEHQRDSMLSENPPPPPLGPEFPNFSLASWRSGPPNLQSLHGGALGAPPFPTPTHTCRGHTESPGSESSVFWVGSRTSRISWSPGTRRFCNPARTPFLLGFSPF